MDQRLRRHPRSQTPTRQVIGCAVVALLLSAGCRTTSPAKSPVTMTWAAYSALQRSGQHPQWPYISRIDSRRGALLYFGAAHSFSPGDVHHTRLEDEWAAFAPDIAFSEGGQPPIASSRDEAVKTAGEAGLVRFLAARDNVPTTTLDRRSLSKWRPCHACLRANRSRSSSF
jgi:hypothetical protein